VDFIVEHGRRLTRPIELHPRVLAVPWFAV
jgi:hypothetical protein